MTCPKCETTILIESVEIKGHTRTVTCPSCGHVFLIRK